VTLHYLLDTNVISEPLRPRPDENVLLRLRDRQGEVGISAVVWHELVYGCNRMPSSARRTTVETYLYEVIAPTMPILPYDERAAEQHAAERARLTGMGKTPPFADGQIAAIAVTNDLILITFNVSDYGYFEGLQVEDWRK
jgi:tRNA(fMet)-specific endonuclease VapC